METPVRNLPRLGSLYTSLGEPVEEEKTESVQEDETYTRQKLMIAATGRDFSLPADISRLMKPGRIDDKGLFSRLYAAGFTHEEIASVFGVSRESVSKMVSKMDLIRESANPTLFQEKMQEEMLIRMEAILKYMTPEKMNKASLSQLVLALGVLFDKMRLVRGESTSNVASINVQKLDPADLDKIKDVIRKHTQAKLTKTRKEYEET